MLYTPRTSSSRGLSACVIVTVLCLAPSFWAHASDKKATAPVVLQNNEGIGELDARNTAGERVDLVLRRVHVRAQRIGDVVECHVEHRFHNPSDEMLEGTFRFPLPSDTAVVGLAMDVGDQLMEGELVEKKKARKIYQNIVDSMRDPAILEWEAGQTFKLRV
ncbi:MAG: VIT domain-containing protein, partial [Myxococcota bacterium]|nr:VIT domain-containing protein [Myxococcota bacterium]